MAGVGGSPLAPRDHRAPVGARLRRRPARAPIAPSAPPIAPSGPDRAPSGPHQGASLLALLYKITRRQNRSRGVPRGFWEGVVLLGISPELIFAGGLSKWKTRNGGGPRGVRCRSMSPHRCSSSSRGSGASATTRAGTSTSSPARNKRRKITAARGCQGPAWAAHPPKRRRKTVALLSVHSLPEWIDWPKEVAGWAGRFGGYGPFWALTAFQSSLS